MAIRNRRGSATSRSFASLRMTGPAMRRSPREERIYILSILCAAVPFAFGLARAFRTGTDFRYLWLAIVVASMSIAAMGHRVNAQTPVAIRAADGDVVNADVYGSGDRAVVLAHGGRFDRTSWKPQARELADAGFRVVAIDFRAAVEARSGRETPCLYDESCLARDVSAAIHYLRETGAKKVSLVGASSGGDRKSTRLN